MCPCHSGKEYVECCRPFHLGKNPGTALELMRSRYAAYALNQPTYIMDTTHPDNPQFLCDKALWSKEISSFSLHTEFKGLVIVASEEDKAVATVTFRAELIQDKEEVSFTEKSLFEKVEGKWLYRSCQVIT
ncbi:MAG: hypothetical protein RLZZ453_4 [Chlamydiota bacterium]|jgi:SEC-C motif-containing protein